MTKIASTPKTGAQSGLHQDAPDAADEGLEPEFKPLSAQEAVVVPAVVFVRALSRQMRRTQPGSALMGLMVWELVKIVLTVALLLVAPKVISDLSWLALVAGFVVTMKVYWLAMALGWMQRKSKPTIF